MKCINILYPAKDNDAFDFEFYLNRHVPLIKDILGNSLHRIEVRKGASSQDGSRRAHLHLRHQHLDRGLARV